MNDAKARLSDLARSPDDDQMRTRAARALDNGGESARAIALLSERFINLTAHEGPPLPCLCKRCLAPERNVARSDGVEFRRDFATRDGRVLYFWVPTDLFGARGLRESVVKRMKAATSRRSIS